MTDYGSEDFVWPEVRDLSVADAFEMLDSIEHETTLTNRRAKLLKERKGTAKRIALDVLDASRQKAARIEGHEGRDVQYTPYEFAAYTIDNDESFREWAGGESERFYDDSPRLREQIFQDEMGRRHQDGEPLPPGVRRYTETRLSRTAVAQRRKLR